MNLADKTILNILARATGALMLLVSSVILARYLTKNDLGTFLQAMLIINTCIVLSFLGLPQSIYYFYHRASNRGRLILQTVILAITIAVFWAIMIYLNGISLASLLNNREIFKYIPLIALIMCFRGISQFRDPVLISADKLVVNSICSIVFELSFYLPTLLAPLLHFSLASIFKFMATNCFIELVCTIALIVFVSAEEKRNNACEEHSSHETLKNISIKEQVTYSLPIGVSSYLGIFGRQIDQYLISIFFSPVQFAVYSRGSLSVPIINDFQYMIHDILMPKYVACFRNGQIKKLLHLFHKATEKAAKMKFPAFFFLFATAPQLIRFLYTSKYDDATPVLRVYLWLIILTVTVYGAIPRASGKTSYISWSTSIAIMVNIIISIMFLPILGPTGAALGTILSSAVNFVFLLFMSCRILGVSIRNILPWSHLSHILLVSLIPSCPLYIMPIFFPLVDGTSLLLYLPLSGFFYLYIWCVLMMRQRLFLKEDLDILSRWCRIDMVKWLPRLTFCPAWRER